MVKRDEDWESSHFILVLLAAAVTVRVSDLGAGYMHGVFHRDRRECCSSTRAVATCSMEGADGAAHLIL
jgi:hypothetical protein